MNNNAGERELTDGAPCAHGVCGPIDYDWVFQKKQAVVKESVPFDEEELFFFILDKGEDAVYKENEEIALAMYDEAYRLAKECQSLGIDYCFGAMFHLHDFGYHEQAFAMCLEIAQEAMEIEDLEILGDLWRLLPEFGVPGDSLNESALILRGAIEKCCPEVMGRAASGRSARI